MRADNDIELQTTNDSSLDFNSILLPSCYQILW